MLQDPILHEVISVSATAEADVYMVEVDITDMLGERYTCHYVSRSDDTFGLAPTIRSSLDQWIADGHPVSPYVPPTIDLAAYAANKRWEKEVGGITLNGMAISTDDRSKIMISGARIKADLDSSFTTNWKSNDGTFTTIDAPTIIAISNAVLAHVDACFAIEAQVLADITAGTITTTAEIDAAFA